MVKCNHWTPAPPSLLAMLSKPPPPPPSITPRTDPPGTPFPFLALPFELREQVYTHLLPPRGLHYRQRDPRAPLWTLRGRKACPTSYIALLQTSRQVHTEAHDLLFRTCSIEVTVWRRRKETQAREERGLRSFLHAMPPSAKAAVTRVERLYSEYTLFSSGEEVPQLDKLFAMWMYLVSQARLFGEYFPALRDFAVRWPLFESILAQRFGHRLAAVRNEGESERWERVQEHADVLVSWLKRWKDEKKFVPPSWLRIEFHYGKEMDVEDRWRKRVQQDALGLAQTMLVRKQVVTTEDLEESGRKWLEGYSVKRVRRRKGWCDVENGM